eukprot:TRINITY_DN1310_c0_g1_i1.p1 TRINITY_DN1310_c0_g1~~TRINITY_DN1310_c0_g1_i1.p1  ORF type:complete len:270 (+),score=41.14 TRINITY_DN1310_c0_g1_i1:802-1611(+)
MTTQQQTTPSHSYRDYHDTHSPVALHYKSNHAQMTVSYVLACHDRLHQFNHLKMSIWDAFRMLDEVYDQSDPDTDLKQTVHALQTAEALREKYPDLPWLHLVGLIHDLGKILELSPFCMPAWAVVGDTYPVGCSYSEDVVYSPFFQLNEDSSHPVYSTQFGIYTPNCGLDNVVFSYGHDEYLYQVLQHNNCLIPEMGKRIIRYHSFYAWHTSGAYTHLCDDMDDETREWVKLFSECDLYSKTTTEPEPETWAYYHELISQYFPEKILEW